MIAATHSSASIGEIVTFAPPAVDSQRVTVTLTDSDGGAQVHVASTYSAVLPSTVDGACTDRLRDYTDPRLIDQVTTSGP